jgi:hypothetical protein
MSDGPARHRVSGNKTIRCDLSTPEEAAQVQRAERTGLLNQFRRWLAAPPAEYRRATRHAARTYVVWLGWWQGEQEFFALTARLANISRGGALVLVRQAPPENHPLWICLGTPEPDECLAAKVLEVRNARRGECAVRLAFREPCPSRFLEAAVCSRTSQHVIVPRPGAGAGASG